MPHLLAPTRRRRGRHRRRAAPLPLVRAAFGALVLAAVVGGVPAAGPAGLVPGSVPVVAQPPDRADRADRVAEVAGVAVQAALAQLGLPYEWGGDGPAAGDAGFDCSGLTRHAYAVAGVALPRTAHTQFYAGPGVPDGMPLQPGDLVFYGTPARVYHVGLYLGDGAMVNAPSRGRPVQVARHRYPGDAYLGATRPAALGDPALVPPRPAPAPAPVPLPEVFDAPPAPLPDGLRDGLGDGPGDGPGDEVRAAGPPSPDALAAGPADVGDIVAARRSVLPGPSPSGDRRPAGVQAPPVAEVPAAAPPAVDPPAVAPPAAAPPAAAPPAVAPPGGGPVGVRLAPPSVPRPPSVPGPSSDPGDGDGAGSPLPAGPATLVATRDRHVVVPAADPGPGGPSPVTGRVLQVPPDLLDGLRPGDPVELTTADVTDDLTVVSRTEVPAGEVAAVTATALAAPGPDGRWTLVVLG